jgi:DNA-binding transcriptional ArsR family regulator
MISSSQFSEIECSNVSELLKSLAHPSRLQLMCHLAEKPYSVGELAQMCGISQSSVSQYLNKFKLAGKVKSVRRGKFSFYEIADPKLHELLSAMHIIFRPEFQTEQSNDAP